MSDPLQPHGLQPSMLLSMGFSRQEYLPGVLELSKSSLVAQRLKCLPPMWETRVRSLGWEDPLEKEMVT